MTIVNKYSYLMNELNKRLTISIQNVAQMACNKLKECIEEQYYKDPDFYPNVYERTEAFLKSATYEMVGKNSARIGIDTANMHYKNGFSSKQVVDWAKKSMHGSPLYKTDAIPFNDTFIEWAQNNLLTLLKNELRKNGLNVR